MHNYFKQDMYLTVPAEQQIVQLSVCIDLQRLLPPHLEKDQQLAQSSP